MDTGRRRPLSRSRALTCDVLHFHRQVPTCAHDRTFDLSAPAELRARTAQRISWSVLFTKAYALVAREFPVLRQMLIRRPWPHVFESRESVGMVAVAREHLGEPWLFWGRVRRPDARPLIELQKQLDAYRTAPVERIFKKQLQFSALPGPLRRAIWSWNLNWAGRKRAGRTGTFFLTTLASQGVEIQHPPAFLTGNLTYGPLDERGHCRVTLAYDHRLTDGYQIAQCLNALETTLTGEIARELGSPSGSHIQRAA